MRRYEIPENHELCLNFLSGRKCTCEDPSNMNKKKNTNENINLNLNPIRDFKKLDADTREFIMELNSRFEREHNTPHPNNFIGDDPINQKLKAESKARSNARRRANDKAKAQAQAQLKAQANDESNPKLQAEAKAQLKAEEDRKAKNKEKREYLAKTRMIAIAHHQAQKQAQFKSEQAKRKYELDRDILLDSIFKPKISDSIKDQN